MQPMEGITVGVGDESVDPVAGDAARFGFAALYAAEYDGMVRLAALLLGSVEAAEEAVQDGFVRLHQRWGSVDNPGGYLRRVVVNRCHDDLRRRARFARRVPLLVVDAVASQPGPEPADDALLEALDRLPVRQRSALILRFHLGCTDVQIAESLGVRPATARSLVHRGLAALREEVTR